MAFVIKTCMKMVITQQLANYVAKAARLPDAIMAAAFEHTDSLEERNRVVFYMSYDMITHGKPRSEDCHITAQEQNDFLAKCMLINLESLEEVNLTRIEA